jgi:hypothetical protein
MKFYQRFRMSKHQFNYLLQKIEKDLKKRILPSETQNTCRETSKLSTIRALDVNVLTQKAFIEVN